MEIFLAFIITFSVFYICSTLAQFQVYGWFISKKVEEKYLQIPIENEMLYSAETNMLFTTTYISPVPRLFFIPNLLYKYEISNYGVAPRWSKLHTHLEKVFKAARERELNTPLDYNKLVK